MTSVLLLLVGVVMVWIGYTKSALEFYESAIRPRRDASIRILESEYKAGGSEASKREIPI